MAVSGDLGDAEEEGPGHLESEMAGPSRDAECSELVVDDLGCLGDVGENSEFVFVVAGDGPVVAGIEGVGVIAAQGVQSAQRLVEFGARVGFPLDVRSDQCEVVEDLAAGACSASPSPLLLNRPRTYPSAIGSSRWYSSSQDCAACNV
ncbi:hypothetical protein [Mycolicibacterium septicum]|uniref:hypothetical protein n=1 Tax=Mycolicibacterium septicum TaxID=98668 RepID=UPI00235FF7E4|nr:hypothetical protein [Mycolicibacterium septicum]